jgi:hypothetical protein
MPTGIVPPTGFICFVPRKDVILLKMSAEDAAKIVISAGMVVPDYQARLRQLAEKARAEAAKLTGENSTTAGRGSGSAANQPPRDGPLSPNGDQAARKRRTASSHSKR